ncbi:MAG TPA: hypothetical protein VMU18_10425 [Rhodoblastus sp.]|nr:hypothetical protein [Rhodoblastus sp.]
MANLGFSIASDFKAGVEPRHRVVTGVPNVDSLLAARRRAPREIYLGLAVIGAAILAFAFPNETASLLRRVASLL